MRARLWIAGSMAVVVAVAVALVLVASRGSRPGADAGPGARPLTVGLWGDVPYTPQDLARMPQLADRMNAAQLDFSVFDGDIKGGRPCDDRVYAEALDRFNLLEAPMVYVPGDNEWTDCWGTGLDPIERLDHLRKVMYPTPASLGKRTIPLDHQLPGFPENTRWVMDDVVFVGVNVPGSNNNKADLAPAEGGDGPRRSVADRRAANAEYQARDEAVRAWLHSSFELARSTGAAGVMVVMQADPGFDVVQPEARVARGLDGFDALLDSLREETTRFGRPVALVHGDTHRYRLDHPLLARDGAPIANLVRCETPGTPEVSWVKATIDRRDPQVFRFEPQPPV